MKKRYLILALATLFLTACGSTNQTTSDNQTDTEVTTEQVIGQIVKILNGYML